MGAAELGELLEVLRVGALALGYVIAFVIWRDYKALWREYTVVSDELRKLSMKTIETNTKHTVLLEHIGKKLGVFQ